jgi:phosphohistidine swiveling domain-containing protein
VDSESPYVIPLADVDPSHEPLVGSKAARLGVLARAGYPVAPGFCVTVRAYKAFLAQSRLESLIRMELQRKPLEGMRWEEIWDTALRIRSAFLLHSVPEEIVTAVSEASARYPADTAWAVRSSSPREDSATRSFAGLHESYVGVVGRQAVVDAAKMVWASLWSDASMLYRKELGLDPARSQMAVLIQTMRTEEVSGVAFGQDPRRIHRGIAIVEAVPGLCSTLVDGQVDPDRWQVRRSDGAVLEWQPGERDASRMPDPLLDQQDLGHLLDVLLRVESVFAWAPDIEWTGRRDRFTLLQARPITSLAGDIADERDWYLTLRPGIARLRKLRKRVAEELIPALEAEGRRLAAEDLEVHTDDELAGAIEERLGSVKRWRQTYREEFIPFAHGVRRLGVYYNDAVRPQDPYEFVGLLEGEVLLATQRNTALRALSDRLRQNTPLCDAIAEAFRLTPPDRANWLSHASATIASVAEGESFLAEFRKTLQSDLDLAYRDTRLADRPDLILRTILEMARSTGNKLRHLAESEEDKAATLEQRLLLAAGSQRRDEAMETIEIARLSWQLRDNDNVLMARVESQLIRAMELAALRLRSSGRLPAEAAITQTAARPIIAALRDALAGEVVLPEENACESSTTSARSGEVPRQLIGQPAAPGLETGKVRCVRTCEDLGRFQAGEVLVCDAIQPMMTHLVPLASAIVERRGGMLIHGAIIARELGIPCVNGVPGVVELLHDGELVTVDGFLGMVTVGLPDFNLELPETK